MTERTALVTGGTRGIGLGVARALAREGWRLALGGVRSENEVGAVLDELSALGSVVHYIQGDLARPADRFRLVDAVGARLGVGNALVNNAGRAPRVPVALLDATPDSL